MAGDLSGKRHTVGRPPHCSSSRSLDQHSTWMLLPEFCLKERASWMIGTLHESGACPEPGPGPGPTTSGALVGFRRVSGSGSVGTLGSGVADSRFSFAGVGGSAVSDVAGAGSSVVLSVVVGPSLSLQMNRCVFLQLAEIRPHNSDPLKFTVSAAQRTEVQVCLGSSDQRINPESSLPPSVHLNPLRGSLGTTQASFSFFSPTQKVTFSIRGSEREM